MAKFCYLMKVNGQDGNNNNKFYKMEENEGLGTFTATYGREGAAKPQSKTYPIHQWDSIYREKTSSKKGYTDITDFKAVKKALVEAVTTNSTISNDKQVTALIELLQQFAKGVTVANYKVEAREVTQAQVDAAQAKLDEISNYMNSGFGSNAFNLNVLNKMLEQLYIIIPRKMVKVSDHLFTTNSSKDTILNKLNDEQTNIDAMSSQVASLNAQAENSNNEQSEVIVKNKTLLESLGLEIKVVTDKKTFDEVKRLAQNHSHRVKNVYSVTNLATQREFDNFISSRPNKKKDLLWHGSRVANWFSIIQQGLKVRPSNAVYTGSMYGDFVYFARESDKSMGYTDSGRWVNNGKNVSSVFMALYDVHLGEQFIIKRHDSSCYNLHKTLDFNKYDSIWAQKGPSLYRDEFMVRSMQSTIKYLVEFSN